MRVSFCFILIIVASSAFSSFALAYIGGQLVNSKSFPGSVHMYMGRGSCSGTKVSEHLILTAAHCNEFGMLNPGSKINLDNADCNLDPHADLIVKNLLTPPSWPEKSFLQDWTKSLDIILIEVDDLSKFEVVPISSRRLQVGDTVVVGGYGLKGLQYPNYQNMTIAFKQVSGILDGLFFVGLKDFQSETMSMGAEGDSGGAAYVAENENLAIVGVNSSVTRTTTDINAYLEGFSSEVAFQVNGKTGAIESTTAPSDMKFYITQIPAPTSIDYQWLQKAIHDDGPK